MKKQLEKLNIEEAKSMSLKGRNHLLLRQICKNGKIKWQMVWTDTNIPRSKRGVFTMGVDEIIRDVKAGKLFVKEFGHGVGVLARKK